jgi:HEAT repeat protein
LTILAPVSIDPEVRIPADAANQPQADAASQPIVPVGAHPRPLLLGIALILLTSLFVGTGTARATWQEISQLLRLEGKPEPASASVLSEHEIEELGKMNPQSQAELLLERSINHYRGANDEMVERLNGWRGKIKLDNTRLNNLFMTALNSDDLRVRAAAIEVDIAARDLEKSPATVDALESAARFGEQGPRANALWDIALLGNRGVDPERALEILLASVHDSNLNIRYWAVEGLAYLGTDATIAPLLERFHDDPSPMIRERAACGLAQSGMLSERQRRSAVPQLLDFAQDPTLDAETRKWVYQALRDITGQSLPQDPAAWRNWYDGHADNWNPVARDGGR